MADYDFDLFVIGAGSGGVRAARLAATERGQGRRGRGVSSRRHLRDPRLRPQEVHGLRQRGHQPAEDGQGLMAGPSVRPSSTGRASSTTRTSRSPVCRGST
ncbi:hypothetical protein ACRAWD_09775 [Caulobacter segnis]